MNELHPVERRRASKRRTTKKVYSSKRARIVTNVRSKAPAGGNPEIPILWVLSKAPEDGVSTRQVLQEVRSVKWFSELDDDDRKARYPSSRKKIVDSVIKFARKNLVMKGEIFPAGDGKVVGIWRITPKGIERTAKDGSKWSPRYSRHDAIIIEEEKKN